MSLYLDGDANDYVAKGLSGGRIVVRPQSELAAAQLATRDRRQHHRLRRDLR